MLIVDTNIIWYLFNPELRLKGQSKDYLVNTFNKILKQHKNNIYITDVIKWEVLLFIRKLKEKGYTKEAELLEVLISKFKIIPVNYKSIMAANDIMYFLGKKEEDWINARWDIKSKDINCFDLLSLWCILQYTLENYVNKVVIFTADAKDFLNKNLYRIFKDLNIKNEWYIPYEVLIKLNKDLNYIKIDVVNLYLLEIKNVKEEFEKIWKDVRWEDFLPF